MGTMQETFARLMTLDLFEFGKPASENDIRHIEAELGVILPEQYVDFLKRFGSTRSFGWQVFGTRPGGGTSGDSTTLTQDCVDVTKQEKTPDDPCGTASLPPDHVVISTDGGGGNIVLFGVGSLHAGEVHYYNLEDQAEPLQVWRTFQDYLKQQISDAGVGE